MREPVPVAGEVCQAVSDFGDGPDCDQDAAVVVLCRVHTDPIGGYPVTLAPLRRVALCDLHAHVHGLGSLAGVTP